MVILTTLRAELDAVLAIDAGVLPGSHWEQLNGPSGLPLAYQTFLTESGAPLRVAATLSPNIGPTAAVHSLAPLVEALAPRYVAMCGVCAGRRGKTQLGDVVVAERLLYRDAGKLFGGVQQELITYRLRDEWKLVLEGLDPIAQFRDAAWFQRRPLPAEWRENRALVALNADVSEPWNAVEPGLGGDAWVKIVDALRARGLLAPSGRSLTDAGRHAAEDLLFRYRGALPDLSPTGVFQPFRVHIAPMGLGAHAVEEPSIWSVVSTTTRDTMAIDGEAAVLGELVSRQSRRQLDVFVMKGVIDVDNHCEDNHSFVFAARAAAEYLLRFLRRIAGVERQVDRSGDRINYTVERQRHARFLGREAILAEIDRRLISDDTDRCVVVTGGPGMGKSAILAAWLARREGAGVNVPHHFIRRGVYGWDEPAQITRSLAAQIEALFPAQRDPAVRPELRLQELLVRVSTRELAPRSERLVLMIDGLDEYDAPIGVANPLAAFLPTAVPHVRLLCAARPRHPYLDFLEERAGAIVRIDLDDPSSANDNDRTVRRFWQREVQALELDERFVVEAVARAAGNMQHAVMLRNYLVGLPPAQRRVDAVPRGLEALFSMLWQRVASGEVAVRGLGVLCAARESLSLDEIAAAAGWTSMVQREVFIRSVSELLVETRRGDGAAEYRLHHDAIRAYIIERVGATALRVHHAALARGLATWPPLADAAARRYALRHALAHRVDAGEWGAVGQLAGDLGFLEAMCRERGVDEVEGDVVRVAERCHAQGDVVIARRLSDLSRALARESHWLRDEPAALPAQLWNRLRRLGWHADELAGWLRVPEDQDFVRVRYVVSRESRALLRELTGHANAVRSCVVTPDGRQAVSASDDGTLKLWELNAGRVLATLEGHSDCINSCVVTPDGRLVVSASSDGTLKIWEFATGQMLQTLRGHAGWVTSCAVTPDGRRVLSGAEDHTLKLWELATGQVLATLKGHAGGVMSSALTPDGRRVISASRDRTLRIWDLDTCQFVAKLEGHKRSVMSCAVTPNGRWVISASRDGTLKLWDLASAREITTLYGHTDRVNSCAVAPDGARIVSASDDATVMHWDLATGKVIATFDGHTDGVNSCVITPDGLRVVSASRDRTIKVWSLEP